MRKTKGNSVALWVFLVGIIGIWVGQGIPAYGQPPDNWTSGIAYDVVPSAKITKVGWYFGKTEAGQQLFYEVGIRNVSDKPVRFKVTIFPLDGEPIAAYYPLTAKKGKPLGVEPEKELVQKFPFPVKTMPKGFAIVVKAMEE